jgi:RNA polymerase sigma-70 factor (ECF subfamily)
MTGIRGRPALATATGGGTFGHGATAGEPVDHELDDGALMSASVHNTEAFARVYDRHAARLYRYAVRRVGPDMAADVVSDAMLTALRKRDRYDATRPNARPWLFGILTREIARRRRVERNHYRALARVGTGDPLQDCHADRVATALTAQSIRAPLAKAIAGITHRERDVLLLIAWEGLSYEEVADALHVPIGTVRSRLHRARRKIRAAFPDLSLGGDTGGLR